MDVIARPPTLALLYPPAFSSQRNVNNASLTSPRSAKQGSGSSRAAEKKGADKQMHLSPGTMSLDGFTVGPPCELYERLMASRSSGAASGSWAVTVMLCAIRGVDSPRLSAAGLVTI